MDMTFLYITLSVVVVSLISLVGLIFTSKFLAKYGFWMVSFAAGALFATAFFDILPEAMELNHGDGNIFIYVLVGIVVFFMIEKFLGWYHCHKGKCDVHLFTYMNLVGDAVHNFTDGVAMAATYLVNPAVGFVTTLAVVFHEIPQEIGDFSLLTYGGFSKKKALWYNFLVALTAIAGAWLTYFVSTATAANTFLLPFAAGGFIYIAGSDLIPELHKENGMEKSFIQFLLFLLGIIVIYATTKLI